MSKLLMIVGILLAALGVTVGLMVAFSSAQMQILGITAEVAAIFLVGGFITLGLGGVVDAVMQSGRAPGDVRDRYPREEARPSTLGPAATVPSAAATAGAVVAAEATRASASAARAAEAAGRVFEPAKSRAAEVTETIKTDAEQMITEARRAAAETSAALDRAKAQIEEALSPEEITIPPGARITPEVALTEDIPDRQPEYRPRVAPVEEVEVEEEPVAEPEPPPPEAEEEPVDDQLYVVEERMIRGRPARVLSDSTVEAETDEGWMRFENLEHLEEYLEAMSPSRA